MMRFSSSSLGASPRALKSQSRVITPRVGPVASRAVLRRTLSGFEDIQNLRPYIEDFKRKLLEANNKFKPTSEFWNEQYARWTKATTDYSNLFKSLYEEYKDKGGNKNFNSYFIQFSLFGTGEAGFPSFDFDNNYGIAMSNLKNETDQTRYAEEMKNWDLLRFAWGQLKPLWLNYQIANGDYQKAEKLRKETNDEFKKIKAEVDTFLAQNSSVLPGVTSDQLLKDAMTGVDTVFPTPEIVTAAIPPETVESTNKVSMTVMPEPVEIVASLEEAISIKPVEPQPEERVSLPEEVNQMVQVLEEVSNAFLPTAQAADQDLMLTESVSNNLPETLDVKKLPKWVWLLPLVLLLRK